MDGGQLHVDVHFLPLSHAKKLALFNNRISTLDGIESGNF